MNRVNDTAVGGAQRISRRTFIYPIQGVTQLLIRFLFGGSRRKYMFEFLGIVSEGKVDKNALAIYVMSVVFALDLAVNVLRV